MCNWSVVLCGKWWWWWCVRSSYLKKRINQIANLVRRVPFLYAATYLCLTAQKWRLGKMCYSSAKLARAVCCCCNVAQLLHLSVVFALFLLPQHLVVVSIFLLCCMDFLRHLLQQRFSFFFFIYFYFYFCVSSFACRLAAFCLPLDSVQISVRHTTHSTGPLRFVTFVRRHLQTVFFFLFFTWYIYLFVAFFVFVFAIHLSVSIVYVLMCSVRSCTFSVLSLCINIQNFLQVLDVRLVICKLCWLGGTTSSARCQWLD